MTDANSSGPQTTPLNVAAKIGWAILIAATLYVCYFSHLGAIGFVGPDEPRYAWIARDMAETGDWVTPRLYGKPWFEKPPLLYWGAAVCFKLFGVSEAAARLPSAICALLATLAMAGLAWRMYGAETARWLLLLLPTTVGMIGFSHAASTDMPFSGMLTIAMVCAAVIVRLMPAEPGGSDSVLSGGTPQNSALMPSPLASASSATRSQTPWLALVLFGFFLGLAVLAKGPAAIILCGGAVFLWALFTKRWRDGFRLLHPSAIAAFCATALPWYILCARRNPDFFRVFIIEHNFKRYLTPEFQHIQPFTYYGPILVLGLLPWVFMPFCALFSKVKVYSETRSADHRTLLFWTTGAFCLLFFSISKSKLPGYILPVIPAAGFVMSETAVRISSRGRKFLWKSAWTSGLLMFTLGLLLDHDAIHLRRSSSLDQSGIAILLFTLVIPVFFLGGYFSGRPNSVRSNAILAVAILGMISPLVLVPQRYFASIDRDVSSRYLAGRVLAHGLASQVCVLNVNRAWVFGLDFYLRRMVPEWQDPSCSGAYVITSLDALGDLRQQGLPMQLVEFGRSAESSNNLSLYRVTTARTQ